MKKKTKKRENGEGWLAIESWRGGGGINTEDNRAWFGFVLDWDWDLWRRKARTAKDLKVNLGGDYKAQ